MPPFGQTRSNTPVPRHNPDAARAPLPTDDASSGYEPLSTWIDVPRARIYMCVVSTAGAAVWREVTNPGVVGVP